MSQFDPYEPAEYEATPSSSRLRPLLILRDVLIVWGFTFVGGFVIGFIAAVRRFDAAELVIAIGLANLLFGTGAFTLIGCIAPPGRWRHLFYVAVFTWLSSAFNIVLVGVTVEQWAFSSIAVLIMFGLGGAFSFLFKSERRDESRPRPAYNFYQTAPDECPMCGAGVAGGAARCAECGEVFS